MPESAPETVEDATRVVIGLGYHYLWVDKYVISDGKYHKCSNRRHGIGL
jgi:hypothetical protein